MPPQRIAIDVRQAPGSAPTCASLAVVDTLLESLPSVAPDWEIVLVTTPENDAAFRGYPRPIRHCCVAPKSASQWLGSLATTKSGNTNGHHRDNGHRPRFVDRLTRWLTPARAIGSGAASGSLARLGDGAGEAEPDDGLAVDLVLLPFAGPLDWTPTIPRVLLAAEPDFLLHPHASLLIDCDHRMRTFAHSLTFADAAVCLSKAGRDLVTSWSGRASSTVVTIAPAFRRQDTPELLDRMALPDSRNLPSAASQSRPAEVLLYPADFTPVNNHRLLLAAFGQYLAENPDSALHLVCAGGGGEDLPLLADAVARIGLADRIRLPIVNTRDELWQLGRHCRGLVAASLCDENLAAAGLAAALAKPLLRGRTGDESAARPDEFLFDPRRPGGLIAALDWLERQPPGRPVPRSFSPEAARMARAYSGLFDQVIARRRSSAPIAFGVHSDGWTSERLALVYPSAPRPRRLVWTLAMPDFAPSDRMQAVFSANGQSKRLELARGEARTLEWTLGAAAGWLEARIEPVFQPAECGLGDDPRALGLVSHGWQVLDG